MPLTVLCQLLRYYAEDPVLRPFLVGRNSFRKHQIRFVGDVRGPSDVPLDKSEAAIQPLCRDVVSPMAGGNSLDFGMQLKSANDFDHR